MAHFVPIPRNVVTTFLTLGVINFNRDEHLLSIACTYGQLETGDIPVILLVTDFEVLNNILHIEMQAGNTEAEKAIEKLAGVLIEEGEEIESVEIWEAGGVNIDSFIFSLSPMDDEYENEDEDAMSYPEKEENQDVDEGQYWISGYTLRQNIIPPFSEILPPPEDRPAYYNAILAARYALYLAMIPIHTEPLARELAELSDPLLFALAKQEYSKLNL